MNKLVVDYYRGMAVFISIRLISSFMLLFFGDLFSGLYKYMCSPLEPGAEFISDPNHGKYAPKDMEMLFTDSSHMMLATDSSHDDVNRRLVDSGEPPVERRCWKASAWVTSLQGPYEEDMWEEVRFDEGPSFRRLRPCNRCMVTTVDFETGTHRKSRQPLVELRS